MNSTRLLLWKIFFALFMLLKASSKSEGSVTPRSRPKWALEAHVHFDLDTLLSTHIATIERALHVTIHSEDVSINIRNLWSRLHPYSKIVSRKQFYPEMFTIGYLLNEAPSAFRFALLSDTFDIIRFDTRMFPILRVPDVSNIFGLLDVVKAYFEAEVFTSSQPNIAGVLIGRPSAEAKFDLQFIVYRNVDQVKMDLALLLRKYGLPTKIEERVEKFSHLRDILYQPKKMPAVTDFFETEMDSESSEIIDSTSGKSSRKLRNRVQFRMAEEESPEPERLRGLLPAIEGLVVETISTPLFDRSTKLPKIPISRSADSFDASLAPLKNTPRDTWNVKGHGNPRLGRKAGWLQPVFKSSVDSSSSDSTV